MSNPLKVLLLEDMKADQELIKRQILSFSPRSILTIADDRDTFNKKVKWFHPDIVLADYNLPDMTGLDALLYFKENLPEVPFIFVTGELNNEEKVAEAVLKGADGYILKNNLHKIPEVLQRVLEQTASRAQKRKKLEDKMNSHQLELQKLYQIVIGAPQFEGKKSMMDILDKLNSTTLKEAVTIL